MKKNLFLLSLLLLIISVPPAAAGEITGKVTAQGLREPKDILIYLDKTPGSDKVPQQDYVMDQNNLTFLPHVLVIPQGATVAFPNNDKVDHNVFSLSRTKKFNFGSYKPGESHSVVFDKPGIVELRCDIHAEMKAYILVMKSSYYGLTDKDGRFKIDVSDLPAGQYRLKTWHEKMKSEASMVDLEGSSSKEINLKLHRGTPGVLYK